MKKTIRLFIGCILLITGLVFGLKFMLKDLNFGLDLIGGFEVLYKIEPLEGSKLTTNMKSATTKSIINRIDTLGVSEPVVKLEGDKVRVQLAGVKNMESARKRLSTPAVLSFRDVNDNLLMSATVLKTGSAKLDYDENKRPAVALKIADNETFAKVTKQISEMESPNNMIVIWLDFENGDTYSGQNGTCGHEGNTKCISAATVNQSFSSDVIIQGNFSVEEAQNLVDLINSGSLPTKLTEISSKNVDADFGADTLNKTAVAGIVSLILIAVFLMIIYHFGGFIASLSLLIYTSLVLLIFNLIGGVLTLPGIAALIIGIGMAIDASIICYERIKDELKIGKGLEKSFIDGKKQSFGAIIDGNLTTLLVGIILYIFGESSVQGFATMLIISNIVTMFSIVFINNILVKLFVKTDFFDKHLNLFLNFRNKQKQRKQINFIKIRKYYYAFLIILFVGGIISLTTKGLNLGIDFKGGSSISVIGEEKIDIKALNNDLKDLGYSITSSDSLNDGVEAYITTTELMSEDDILKINNLVTEKYGAKSSISGIDDIVKKDLVKNAIISVILGFIGIIIYVALRFKFSYGISGVLALVNDLAVIIIAFSLFSLEVNVIFIAALLAILGYSINDTIVIFDRIRENINKASKIKTKEEFAGIINKSQNETLTRSIWTSITTIISVVCLLVIGSREIATFNIALLIGLIIGSFSSILLAGGLWYDLEKKNIGKTKKEKKYDEDELDELVIKGINS